MTAAMKEVIASMYFIFMILIDEDFNYFSALFVLMKIESHEAGLLYPSKSILALSEQRFLCLGGGDMVIQLGAKNNKVNIIFSYPIGRQDRHA